jgi:hypothetical protein
VVVGTGPSEGNGLPLFLKVSSELLGCEGRPTVRDVGHRNHSKVAAHVFKGLLGAQGLMGVQVDLVLNVYKSGGIVNKDTSASVHVALITASSRGGFDPFCGADKVID